MDQYLEDPRGKLQPTGLMNMPMAHLSQAERSNLSPMVHSILELKPLPTKGLDLEKDLQDQIA